MDPMVTTMNVIYLQANYDLEESAFDGFVDRLLCDSSIHLLKQVLQLKSLCMQAFEQKLLLYAARTNRCDLKDFLLNRCTFLDNPDDRKFEILRTMFRAAIFRKSEQFCVSLFGDVDSRNQICGVNITSLIDCDLVEQASHWLLSLVPIMLAHMSADERQGALPSAVQARVPFKSMESLLNEVVDVNTTDKFCRTALHHAIRIEDIGLIRVLLARGADTEALHFHDCGERWESGERYFTCEAVPTIFLAAAQDSLLILNLLLEAGVDVNSTSYRPRNRRGALLSFDNYKKGSETVGWQKFANASQIAVWNNNTDLLDALVGRGGKLSTVDGLPLLVLAAFKSHSELVDLLLACGADVHEYSAVSGGDDWRDESECEREDESQCYNALQAACMSADSDIVVKRLVNAGANINSPAEGKGGRAALQMAVEHRNVHAVACSLEHGAHANAPCAENGGLTALQAGVKSGNIYLVEMLLQYGADLNGNGQCCSSPFLTAVEENSVDFINILLSLGVNIDGPSSYGRSLAEDAILQTWKMSSQMLRLILKHTRFLRLQEAEVSVALARVWDGKDVDFLLALIEWGYAFRAQDNSVYYANETFLQKACREGQVEAVKLLLQSGADINHPGSRFSPTFYQYWMLSGRTALAYASGEGDLLIVKILLEHGAKVNIAAGEYSGRTSPASGL